MSEFRVVVAGSRTFKSYPRLCAALDHYLKKRIQAKDDVIIISGGARGADQMGEQYAKEHNLKCEIYPADWNKFGKSAGYKRNVQMGNVGDALVLFWDGMSKGSAHMLNTMYKMGKVVRIVRF